MFVTLVTVELHGALVQPIPFHVHIFVSVSQLVALVRDHPLVSSYRSNNASHSCTGTLILLAVLQSSVAAWTGCCPKDSLAMTTMVHMIIELRIFRCLYSFIFYLHIIK